MLFGKRKKDKSADRVLDLKARVDALRQADAASREKDKPYSLDHFLEGDDVLTGREVQDRYTPAGWTATDASHTGGGAGTHGASDGHEVDLEAELQKYLQRQESQGQDEASSGPAPRPQQPFATEEDASPRQSAPGTPAREPHSSWPESPESAWPDSQPWPADEEWPPRDEKAV